MKTVLISGAGGNLGAAAVNVFAAANWRVIGIVTPGKRPQSSGSILYREADLQSEENGQHLIRDLIAEYGSLDAALLLVGGFESGGLDKADATALRRMYSLNFETAYNLVRPLMPHMKENGGKIVLIGAKPALDARAGKGLVAYGLSKSLLFKLAEYLNAAADRIIAHVVVFQALDTPQNRSAMPGADQRKWARPESVAASMLRIVSTPGGEVIVEVG